MGKSSVAKDHMRSFGLSTDTEKMGRLREWELRRLTAAEICCDEALTILERYGLDPQQAPVMLGLRMLSRLMHDHLTEASGAETRHLMLREIRGRLDRALPAA